MIAETRSHIFTSCSRFRRRRVCLSFLMTGYFTSWKGQEQLRDVQILVQSVSSSSMQLYRLRRCAS